MFHNEKKIDDLFYYCWVKLLKTMNVVYYVSKWTNISRWSHLFFFVTFVDRVTHDADDLVVADGEEGSRTTHGSAARKTLHVNHRMMNWKSNNIDWVLISRSWVVDHKSIVRTLFCHLRKGSVNLALAEGIFEERSVNLALALFS